MAREKAEEPQNHEEAEEEWLSRVEGAAARSYSDRDARSLALHVRDLARSYRKLLDERDELREGLVKATNLLSWQPIGRGEVGETARRMYLRLRALAGAR